MRMPEQNKASKMDTSESQRRENQPDQQSSGAGGNDIHGTHQADGFTTDAPQIRTGPVGQPGGTIDITGDQSIPGNVGEAKNTVRNNSRNMDNASMPAPSQDRTASETPGTHPEFENQPRGSMSGSWETTDRASGSGWQNHDAKLSGGEGAPAYDSPWTGKQDDGEEGPM